MFYFVLLMTNGLNMDGFVKTIWMYWHQGEASAPPLVKHCIASWRHHHPDWNIVVLDQHTLKNHLDISWLPKDGMTLQWFTDVARLELLKTHGGVWADATLFCVLPLDNWLHQYLQDNFFVFDSELKDRLISNWFIASLGNNRWIEAWANTVKRYALSHTFSDTKGLSKFYYRKVMSLRKRGIVGNAVWFNYLTTRLMKLRPYPMAMFLFEEALQQYPDLQADWQRREHFKDDVCHQVQNIFKMNAPCTPAYQQWLKAGHTPVHKLNWRQDTGSILPGSNFEYLLRSQK